MWQRAAAVCALAVALALGTGCFERFERLITRVTYDPVAQSYAVERTLVNVSAGFLLCVDADTCEMAIWRALASETSPGYEATIADRLVQRLNETGAEDVRLTLHRTGDTLDVLARYGAAAGSRAADDTLIRAEWGGKKGKEDYYLVVESQPGLAPLDGKYTVRKSAATAGWAESWVLPARRWEVTTTLAVDQAQGIFAQIPGLAERIAPWLDREWPLGQPPPQPATADSPAVVAVDLAPVPVPVPVPDLAPVPAPAPALAPSTSSSWPAPDPTSNAKVWVYDPRITGGYPLAAAQAAFAPILPRIAWCYQQRAAAVPGLGGSLFLDAVVQSDGSVSALSAFGDVPDRELLGCANRAIEDWRFPAGALPTPAQVTIPLALRVEVPPELPGKKKR